jgi:hypothetical protein
MIRDELAAWLEFADTPRLHRCSSNTVTVYHSVPSHFVSISSLAQKWVANITNLPRVAEVTLQ